MHAFDDGVGGDDEFVGGRCQDRRIVGQIERARIGSERPEIARDEGVLTGAHDDLPSHSRRTLHPHPEERPLGRVSKEGQRARCLRPSFETPRKRAAPQDEGGVCRRAQLPTRKNSSPRNWRAIWSSTALTMPVSSPSTKACATSTYSDTTTRAGTSLRCSSS